MSTPPNHGKPWSAEEILNVQKAYRNGASVTNLMHLFGRTRIAINAKLSHWQDRQDYSVPEICPDCRPILKQGKVLPMKIVIEDKKLINGVDIKDMSDDDVFKLIAQAESEVKKLSTIEHQPKVLKERIEHLNTGIADLVALWDEHTAK